MEIVTTESIPVTDPSSVGEVRRAALSLSHPLGFDETRAGELALLATEVSRNVLVHGGGGQVILAGIRNGTGGLARVLALDNGPGIADMARAMSDGYSTAGTMGGGMGAMRRMASTFEIFTGSRGTAVLLEVGTPEVSQGPQVAGMTLVYPGEKVCGDGWAVDRSPERTAVMLIDGLGHGWGAFEAAKEAEAIFAKYADLSPADLLGRIHDALRKTRGAVAAIAEIRPQAGKLEFAGIGNISAVLLNNGASRSLASYNGTLGATISRIQPFSFPWGPSSTLVLHTDGLQSRWDLSAYSGLLARHAAIVGGVLLRDFRRQRDDAGVVVIKAA